MKIKVEQKWYLFNKMFFESVMKKFKLVSKIFFIKLSDIFLKCNILFQVI